MAIGAVLLGTAGCTGSAGGHVAETVAAWSDTSVNAVSRPMSRGGVTAVTGLRPDGRLETAVYDLATGRRRWSQPAAMAGRLPGMGVQPPAVAGPARAPVVAALEPRGSGRGRATLVVRDARTGAQRWTRPVDSTFGPVRCGPQLCMSEFTTARNARFVALDSATGRTLWSMPGVAEVEASDERRAVVYRMARHPVLESRDLRTGRTLWSFPVERAVGEGVALSGGWSFTALGDTMVGYLAPYQEAKGRPLSAFGFFGLRMADGRPVWTRKRLLRVYPGASPAVSLMAREVDARGGYGGFAQLDPRTGRTIARVPADRAPRTAWWLAFPDDLSKLGFLSQNGRGTAFDLRRGAEVPARGLRAWSFCTVNPAELRIEGHRGFYPIAPLCAYDLGTGRRVADPGPPPAWYTGAVDGWRVWRDEQGVLHAVRDTTTTIPGMYG
ncbi:outer membrane protein assembly factor BamB family protein [Thermomonospora echinospora]|uniref:outer membrane protein assembly factor BamB family protein n=1 Tax=Thermomonospora echinospora TaxID=1992 RepID=UPI001F2CD578|nr:PQQ-binding-like beta-propeller repeat protein [Thermomonospora echinospora]